MHPVTAGETAVDQVSECHGQRECRGCGCHECQERERPATGIGAQERKQRKEGADTRRGRCSIWHGIPVWIGGHAIVTVWRVRHVCNSASQRILTSVM